MHAFLQPDGGWGWSNAGLIVADAASLLIDTLFDLSLTAEMLAAMRPLLARSPLSGAFNTHGNGDHCYGNQLLPDALPIYATELAAEEIRAVPPAAAQTLFKETDLGADFVAWAREAFGPFDWTGIETRPPTDTFAGATSVYVGQREVRLIAVGPAHTSGDAIAYVPDAAAVFTGDILFAASTPVMWAGPVSSWIAAADDIDLGAYADWGDAERIAVNVEMVYRELDPGRPAVPVPELFVRMARWKARHRRRIGRPNPEER